MKTMKMPFQKSPPPSEAPLASAAPADSTGEAITQPPRQRRPPVPSVMKLPAALMEELFPVHDTMVSVIFGPTVGADAPLPADAAIPPELPQPSGTIKTPELLAVSDELREAIFPRQQVMVSVIFNLASPKPLASEPYRQRLVREDSICEHDFPIV